LVARWRGRGRHTPLVYFDEQDEPPDIGVREPRRPRPDAGSGSVQLDLPE
jgi:hypothetical protein